MLLIRFNSRLLMAVILVALLAGACASPPSLADAPDPTATTEPFDLCSQLPSVELFDLQAAAVMQTLLGDDQFSQLGESGARNLIGSYYSPTETFCGLDVPDELEAALAEIEGLYNSGQDQQAEYLLDDLLQEVEDDQFSSIRVQKIAAPAAQAGRESASAKVRHYLTIAGRAAYWGNDTAADDALDAARQTYQSWASEAVDSATIREALRIAAEASLLGLDNLSDQALERARDLAELDLMGKLDLYEPCSATREETGKLLDAAAGAELLGVDTDRYDFMSEAREWLEIQQLRKDGKDVPQCDRWELEMVLDEVWDQGSHLITWEGQFKVLDDKTLSGEGKGSLATHTEVNCVNVMTGEEYISTTDVSGSFTFRIEGKQVGTGEESQFKFLFPAEVDYSGVDTCNDFEKDTYLPANIIEEINVFGGVENYDPELDTIYMVLPAEDGASQRYETLIGPVELHLRYLSGTGR
ncbi:MAG: hypothetical protein P8Y37_08695 [Anaerolineales bacterium]